MTEAACYSKFGDNIESPKCDFDWIQVNFEVASDAVVNACLNAGHRRDLYWAFPKHIFW